MLECSLGMRMTKTISSPSYFNLIVKVLLEEVHSQSVLVENIVVVADSFIILHPAAICDFKLTCLKELFDFLLLIIIYIIVPVFKEDRLSDKIFSFRIS